MLVEAAIYGDDGPLLRTAVTRRSVPAQLLQDAVYAGSSQARASLRDLVADVKGYVSCFQGSIGNLDVSSSMWQGVIGC